MHNHSLSVIKVYEKHTIGAQLVSLVSEATHVALILDNVLYEINPKGVECSLWYWDNRDKYRIYAIDRCYNLTEEQYRKLHLYLKDIRKAKYSFYESFRYVASMYGYNLPDDPTKPNCVEFVRDAEVACGVVRSYVQRSVTPDMC